MRFVELCKCFGMLLVPFAIVFQTGCDVSSRVGNIPTEEVDISDFTFPAPSQAPASGYEFETPVRIMAGGEYVSVESPGYACPTMADVDEDGKLDLVVGQFNGGKMHYCKNIAQSGATPEFSKSDWIKTGTDPAEVPGVW